MAADSRSADVRQVHPGGVDAADTLVKTTPGQKVVIGISQGSMVVDQVERNLATDPNAPPKDELTFVAVADPTRPGGLFSAFRPGVHVPFLDYTAQPQVESQYNTIVLVQEYDGVADFPDRPWNLLAVANAVAGIVYLHLGVDAGGYREMPQSGGVTTVNSLGGKTTTYLLPTKTLPLTQPLRDLGVPSAAVDAMDAVLRPAIDAGYSRNRPKPSSAQSVAAQSRHASPASPSATPERRVHAPGPARAAVSTGAKHRAVQAVSAP